MSDTIAAGKRASTSPPEEAGQKRPARPGNQLFSPELLRLYYSRLFPGNYMYKWLSYGHDPKVDTPYVDKGFLMRREFSFTIEDDVYIRYLSFKDGEDMMNQIQLRQPHKIDIGAIYSHPPKDHNTVNPAAFKPLGRELVFDIDLTDYDEVRTCCSGASICGRCWPLMTVALRVVNRALTEDFGFQHLFWVYSGRRGIHCWVCDPAARALPDGARSAIAANLTVVTGNDNTRKQAPLTSPLYPSLASANEILLPHFLSSTIAEEGQRMLCEPDLWRRLIAMVPPSDDLHGRLDEAFQRLDTPQERWEALKKHCQAESKRVAKTSGALARELLMCSTEIVFAFTYPRLDVNVSTHRNHLLKSPFCAHPKTGRVCVPITVETCGDFDPERVPTLAALAGQINAYDSANPGDADSTADVEKTELAAYIKAWQRDFIQPLYKDIRQRIRESAEKSAATAGTW